MRLNRFRGGAGNLVLIALLALALSLVDGDHATPYSSAYMVIVGLSIWPRAGMRLTPARAEGLQRLASLLGNAGGLSRLLSVYAGLAFVGLAAVAVVMSIVASD